MNCETGFLSTGLLKFLGYAIVADRRAAEQFDLAVVGAGIVGLATALAGARRGMYGSLSSIAMPRPMAPSIRNFGFIITVTGQERGPMWRRARQGRDVWCDVAAAANIPILHTGLWIETARPPGIGGRAGRLHGDGNGCGMPSSERVGGAAQMPSAWRA